MIASDDGRWTFYDEKQNMRNWPCLGSRRYAYATGAGGPAALECVECGKLLTLDQLVGGLVPYHAGTRRTARQRRRKDRAARKRRRGW